MTEPNKASYHDVNAPNCYQQDAIFSHTVIVTICSKNQLKLLLFSKKRIFLILKIFTCLLTDQLTILRRKSIEILC